MRLQGDDRARTIATALKFGLSIAVPEAKGLLGLYCHRPPALSPTSPGAGLAASLIPSLSGLHPAPLCCPPSLLVRGERAAHLRRRRNKRSAGAKTSSHAPHRVTRPQQPTRDTRAAPRPLTRVFGSGEGRGAAGVL